MSTFSKFLIQVQGLGCNYVINEYEKKIRKTHTFMWDPFHLTRVSKVNNINIKYIFIYHHLLEKFLPIHLILELSEDTLDDDTTIVLQPLLCNKLIAS